MSTGTPSQGSSPISATTGTPMAGKAGAPHIATPKAATKPEDLIKRIQALGPWHMNIQLNDQLNTGQVFNED